MCIRDRSERVRTIRRPRRKHAGEWIALVPAWMHLQHTAPSLMKPGNDDDLVAGGEQVQALRESWMDLEPRVGCAFRSLTRRVLSSFELRPDHTDLLQSAASDCCGHCLCTHVSSLFQEVSCC